MTVVAAVIAAFAAVLTIASTDLAAVLIARQRGIVAAEAAAVAAADAATWLSDADPFEEARRLTEANGAALVSCSCAEGASTVDVEVRVEPETRFVLAWLDVHVRVARRADIDPWVASWAP